MSRIATSLIFLILLLLVPLARAQQIEEVITFRTLNYDSGTLNLRILTKNPSRPPIGDVLYIHGFADRADNHEPLFSEWTKQGLRVISFDLPSHGENSGSYNDLNNFNFQDLFELAAKVETFTKSTDVLRPLILAGWSTGGLILVRAFQEGWVRSLSRPISGAILFAPGVSVRKFPWTFGNRLGMVTPETLTHDPQPPHHGSVKPNTPFWNHLIYGFAPDLLYNSALSQIENYPENVPTLVFSGGPSEDMYAKSTVVQAWIQSQNQKRVTSKQAKIVNIQCPHAMHEIDNELPQYGGIEVRKTAAVFAQWLITHEQSPLTFGNVCHGIN